jgi:hypothetical protein
MWKGSASKTVGRNADREVLYRSEDLLVVGVLPFTSRSTVITFTAWSEEPSLDKAGFGETFLTKYGFDAVHVICRDNQWYQYADIRAALDAAAARTALYRNRVAMGWSMGAYAAINFSEDLGVSRVIAVSPQFSVDPIKVDFETRWRRERAAITFRQDLIDSHTGDGAEVCVIYDDLHSLDRRHVELIRNHLPNLRELRLPGSGHPAGSVLLTLGILSTSVVRLIEGEDLGREIAALRATLVPICDSQRPSLWARTFPFFQPRRDSV